MIYISKYMSINYEYIYIYIYIYIVLKIVVKINFLQYFVVRKVLADQVFYKNHQNQNSSKIRKKHSSGGVL